MGYVLVAEAQIRSVRIGAYNSSIANSTAKAYSAWDGEFIWPGITAAVPIDYVPGADRLLGFTITALTWYRLPRVVLA